MSGQGRPSILASEVAGQVALAQLKSKVTAKRKFRSNVIKCLVVGEKWTGKLFYVKPERWSHSKW